MSNPKTKKKQPSQDFPKHHMVKISSKDTLREFIPFFALAAILVTAALFFYKIADHKTDVSILLAEEKEKLLLARTMLIKDFRFLTTDLLVLSNSASLKDYCDEPNQENKSKLEKRFFFFSRDRQMYYQVQFIDQKGQQRAVVKNFAGESRIVVPKNYINQRQKTFFKKTVNLFPNEIYLSSLMPLKIRGKIVEPHRPIIKFATPVTDRNGHKKGILVLTCFTRNLLLHLSNFLTSQRGVKYFLFNNIGLLLSNPKDRTNVTPLLHTDKSFIRRYPGLFKEMQEKIHGQIRKKDGIFTFETVYPLKSMRAIFPLAQYKNYAIHLPHNPENTYWIIFSHIPGKLFKFNVLASSNLPSIYLLLGMYFILALITWQLASAKALRKKIHRSLRLLSTALEQSPTGVIITSKDGIIEYLNPTFSKLTGFSLQETKGKDAAILSGQTKAPQDMAKALSNGETWRGEFFNQRKNGSSYWTSAQVAPIMNSKGQVAHFVGLQEDISEKKQLELELEKAASLDGLTGIMNRHSFFKHFNRELDRAKRYKRTFSMLMMDLDKFKVVNDTYGHQAGDCVLKEFSKIISRGMRKADLFGRYGGEEFVAILPETDIDEAYKLAQRLRTFVAQRPIVYNDQKIHITVSIGCSQWSDKDKGLEQLVARADEALYSAKNNGRNRVEIA